MLIENIITITMIKAHSLLLAAIASISLAHGLPAAVVDWSSSTWTPGSLANSFDVDSANPGTDVSVTITGDTSRFRPDPGSQTPLPAIDQKFEGGFGSPQSALDLGVNFQNLSQSITVTVDFSALYAQGVSGVTFTLFGIDARSGQYQDKITSISAIGMDGSIITPTLSNLGPSIIVAGTSIAPVLKGGAPVPNAGSGSGDGNATISFGSTAIRSFTFTYTSGGAGPENPSFQSIGISDITFGSAAAITPVPEAGFGTGAAALFLIAIVSRKWISDKKVEDSCEG